METGSTVYRIGGEATPLLARLQPVARLPREAMAALGLVDVAQGGTVKPPPATAAPRPSLTDWMASYYGGAWDAASHSVDMALLADQTAAERTALARELTQRLAGAGIDAAAGVAMTVAGDGTVEIDAAHPQAAEIKALVNGDTALQARVQRLANIDTLLAFREATAQFQSAWRAADGEARQTLAAGLPERFAALDALADRLSLRDGAFETPAMAAAQAMTFG